MSCKRTIFGSALGLFTFFAISFAWADQINKQSCIGAMSSDDPFVENGAELFSPGVTIYTPANADSVRYIKSKLIELQKEYLPVNNVAYNQDVELVLKQAEVLIGAKNQQSEAEAKAKYPQAATARLVDNYARVLSGPGQKIYLLSETSDPTQKRFSSPYTDGFLDKLFFFQYRYLFFAGDLTMMDYIEIRESGEIKIGVPADSLINTNLGRRLSKNLLQIDYRRVYKQKLMDAKQFAQLGIEDIEVARSFKSKTNSLLQARLSELRTGVEEASFMDAIQVVLFAMLHEYAYSYPLQVVAAMHEQPLAATQGAGNKDKFLGFILSGIARGEYDKYIVDLLGRGDEKKLNILSAAYDWVKTRAEADAQQFANNN